MFTTSKPIAVSESTTADKAFLVVHFAPVAKDGQVRDTVLIRSKRCVVSGETITPVGNYVDLPLDASNFEKLRQDNAALDQAFKDFVSALEAIAPSIGL